MQFVVFWSIWIVGVALAACAGSSIEMSVVYRSSQCSSQQPGLVSLKDPIAVEQVISNRTSFQPQQGAQAAVDLNFQEKHIVLVAMGEKPTAGYRIRVGNEAPTLEGDTLSLPIQYENPDSGMQAQLLTSPCLIVSVDKGAYQTVRVQNYSLPL